MMTEEIHRPIRVGASFRDTLQSQINNRIGADQRANFVVSFGAKRGPIPEPPHHSWYPYHTRSRCQFIYWEHAIITDQIRHEQKRPLTSRRLRARASRTQLLLPLAHLDHRKCCTDGRVQLGLPPDSIEELTSGLSRPRIRVRTN